MSYKSGRGRKIRRSRSLYGNRRNAKLKSIIALVATLIVAAALIFLGYSIGEPLFNYLKNPPSTGSSDAPWTPPSVDETDEVGSGADGTAVSTQTAEVTSSSVPVMTDWSAVEIDVADLSDAETFKSALSDAKVGGYTVAVVTLKAQGGKVYYATSADLAKKNEEIISSSLTAEQICSEIRNAGLIPIARISTLYDNLAPKTSKDAGYLFENSASSWYDNRVDNGGKPWLSPFSESAKNYLVQIKNEVAAAGFDGIIVSDTVFPPFRKNDLNYIGSTVKDESGRGKALLDVSHIFDGAAEISMYETSASKILSGTDEAFKSNGNKSPLTVTVIDIDFDAVGNKFTLNGQEISLAGMSAGEKTTAIIGALEAATGDKTFIPRISSGTMDDGDRSEAVKALVSSGHKQYIVG